MYSSDNETENNSPPENSSTLERESNSLLVIPSPTINKKNKDTYEKLKDKLNELYRRQDINASELEVFCMNCSQIAEESKESLQYMFQNLEEISMKEDDLKDKISIFDKETDGVRIESERFYFQLEESWEILNSVKKKIEFEFENQVITKKWIIRNSFYGIIRLFILFLLFLLIKLRLEM